MRPARRWILLLIAVLACSCFSTRALAVFRMPGSLKEIGDSAFEGVPMPETCVIPYGTEKTGSRAFAGTADESSPAEWGSRKVP